MATTTSKKPPVKPKGQDISDTDLILVDGKNTLWRAAYATSSLGYHIGDVFHPTGAVYGFLEAVLSVAYKAPEATIVIAWEGSRKNRREIVPSYKAYRDADERIQAMWEIVGRQKAILCGLLEHSSWIQARSPKWEADDTIATLAESGRRQKLNVLMYTNDGDLKQNMWEANCANPDASARWIRQYAVSTKSGVKPVWTSTRLYEETGLWPNQITHLKGLAGDSSDGYTGVPGVGAGTASKWLAEFTTLNGVVAAAKAGKITGKRASDVIEHEELARACYEIAITQRNVPIDFTDGKPSEARTKDVLGGLRFHSLNNDKTIHRMTR